MVVMLTLPGLGLKISRPWESVFGGATNRAMSMPLARLWSRQQCPKTIPNWNGPGR